MLNYISFFLLLFGLFLVFFKIFMRDQSNEKRKPDLSEQKTLFELANRRENTKKSGIRYVLNESKFMLKVMQKEDKYKLLLALSLMFACAGSAAALLMKNYLLSLVMLIGMSLLPYWYLKLKLVRWKQTLNNELETTLSLISISYIRTDNIIYSIEENLQHLHPPILNVFESFLSDVQLINSNIKLALKELRGKIDNDIFKEWVDAIIDCQDDKSLKTVLLPIVAKLSDIRTVSMELNSLLKEPIKEFIIMCVLFIINLPLIYMLNKVWFEIMVHSFAGKIVIGLTTGIFFIAIAGVIRLSKPVEYRR